MLFVATVVLLLCMVTGFRTVAQETGRFTDPRDGHAYRTVKIGTQVWMAENLNYKTDGVSVCYANDEQNCRIYGRLYDWETAMKVAPKGWHLPSEQEWQVLERYIGMQDTDLAKGGYRGAAGNISGKLKSTDSCWKQPNVAATNITGFSVLPGGCFGTVDNSFVMLGYVAMIWTATSGKGDFAFYRDIDNGDGIIFKGCRSKKLAFSVRCVKD